VLVAAVDSATLTLSCALCELADGEVRVLAAMDERAAPRPAADPGAADRGRPPPAGHSVRLPAALLELLERAGRKLSDVGAYAVGIGPGSFTGLRIGLATWKGLAYAQRRPIAGASSLAALALAGAGAAPDGALLVPLLDAKKGEVYAGFYAARGGRVEAAAPEAALGPEALLARVAELEATGSQVWVLGEGRRAFGDRLAALRTLSGGEPTGAGPALETPTAAAVARLAAPALAEGFDAQKLFALEPHYVRASEAEVKFPHGLGPGATPPRTA
jgi:tRNA threonylcarbamoyladenosine biosynthesis protein TsaB